MKKIILLSASALALFVASCGPKNSNDPGTPAPASDVEILTGDISASKTLSASKKYMLKGFVYVTNGATLTIEPGTVIMGEKASKGTLIITRGAKIMAEGTAAKPIVFTSYMPAGGRSQGDWGGLILLGKAPINSGAEAKIEGGLTPTSTADEKKYIYYGGTDANDNSGVLKYVRIEFAGMALSPDNEINSLTMGGVGAGTKISYVQVYRAGDDAFEWFGGTVNCDHLVATYTLDDDFDTDNGYSGNVQFGLAHRTKSPADVSKSNGFESDNNGSGTDATPQTSAKFSNITVVGAYKDKTTSGVDANFQSAAHIRRNSAISIYNSILMGFPVGLLLDNKAGTPTTDNIAAGKLNFKNNIIAGAVTALRFDKGAGAPQAYNIDSFFANNSNIKYDSTSTVGLKDIYKYGQSVASPAGRPDFRLTSTSPAIGGASFTGLTGFEVVKYRGAFDENNDWTADWTNWDAENTKY